jgi:outer membrane protein assembly factor BamB
MPVLRSVLVGICGVTLAAGAAFAAEPDRSALEILAARSEAPAEAPLGNRPGSLDRVGGTLLLSMVGADNANCVRAIPDVTGDGLDEIVVGIEESLENNIFCLDGASVGTASVVWSFEPYGGLSGGWVYGDQSLVPASDADGNGFANLLVATAGGGRTAYSLDTFDGAVHWHFDTYVANNPADGGWVYSMAEMGDVTDDGVPEVALGVGFAPDSAIMVDGSPVGSTQAAQVWRYSAGDAVSSVRNLGDVNGDGDDDALIAVYDSGYMIRCLDGGTTLPGGDVVWSYPTGGRTAQAVAVLTDLTGDGINEALAAVWASDGSAVRCLNGATGAELWRSTTIGGSGMMVDVIADLNSSGSPDVIVSSWENAVSVLEGSDGSEIWKTTVGTTNGGDVWTARAISDLDGDGIDDVVAGSFDLHAYAMSGVDGEILWSYNTGNRVFSIAPVGDLDGDGGPEVVVGTQDTSSFVVVHVIDGGDGPIFIDGFESGDTGAWSVVAP